MTTDLRIYTIEEIADLLKVTPGDVRNLIVKGRLESVKISKYIRRITAAQLENFLNETPKKPVSIDKVDNRKAVDGYLSFPKTLKTEDKVTRQALREEMRQW